MKRRDSLNSLPAPSLCARSPAERSSYRDRNLGDLYNCDQPVENRCGIYLMHAGIGQHGDEGLAGRDEHFSTLFEALHIPQTGWRPRPSPRHRIDIDEREGRAHQTGNVNRGFTETKHRDIEQFAQLV